ncbi:uncharacterized protein L201_003351 [Kwoniella dendrophila CBS 6074]|uniref:RRM domain-containing protein n=1 Tax=Kwoniella dendrophila CBS 6074 TaxID=1295534 RepID=A0AAX4JV62_9TREE
MADQEPRVQSTSQDVADVVLADLSEVLVRLETEPISVPLIRKQINLMGRLGMTAEVLDGYQRLSSLVMLDEASSPQPLSLDAFVDILEKFDQTEQDYLSITILARHIEFIFSCFGAGQPESSQNEKAVTVESDVNEFLTIDTTRSMIKAIYTRAEGLMSDSGKLWQLWLDWELNLLGNSPDKDTATQAIHLMFSDRMKIPHTTRMVGLTEASRSGKQKLNEKRYGKTRNDFEEQLAYATDVTTQMQIYFEYAAWESDIRARTNNRGKGPQADHLLTQSVYERAIIQYSRANSTSQIALDTSEDLLQEHSRQEKGKHREDIEIEAIQQSIKANEETVRAYKDAEAAIWTKYGEWAEKNGSSLQDITVTYEKSLSLGLLTTPAGRTSDLVAVILCRAAYENRLEPPEDVEVHPVLVTILRGFDLIAKANKSGDASLKLEKFLLSWVEGRAPSYLEQALVVIDTPNKSRSSAYQMVLLHADVLRKKIEKEQEKVTRRREKAAVESQTYQMLVQTTEVVAEDQPMDVDKNEVSVQPPADRQEQEQPYKRDREHTTIMIAGLPKNVSRDRVEALFADCGILRETTILPDADSEFDTALIEFSNYGRILQTRWPSRKYASNRRFCYVTMESPSAAQEALLLHGYKTGNENFGMSVLISDPSAKTQRSDASNSTLFIGGLDSKTTETDVRGLLQGVDAKACLPLDGTAYLKKFLKVQLSDPNFANKKAKDRNSDQAAERKERLVTLSNLPEKTQEGLLQQALEKVVSVRRLELFSKTQEAVAELETSQDVGKLLLGAEPFVFGGNEIRFTDQRSRPAAPKAEAITATSFAPRAARKAKVIAKPRPTAAAAVKDGSSAVARGQDDFRAMVAAKNKQREDKLVNAKEGKRKADHEENDDAKRPRS